jgi:hypothetical protein
MDRVHKLNNCINIPSSQTLRNVEGALMLWGFHISTGVCLQVLEAYKLGVAALKSTLKRSGLTEDSVADTMVQLEEVSWHNKQTEFLFSYRRYL